jgi:hypothetical protein
MRIKIIVAILVVLSFVRCNSSDDSIKFSNKYLEGNWMVIATYESDKTLEELQPIRPSSVKVENEILNVYHFTKDNTFVLDTGSIAIINGTYKIEDTTINIKKNGSSKFFTATKWQDSTMMMVTDFPNDANGKLVYEFVKVKAIPNFDVADTKWKTPLPATATDNAIKDKLITLLKYYQGYYTTIYTSGSRVFSQQKFCLPLKLYAGGVSAKSVAETPGFVELMGSTTNAEKGLKKLNDCFAKLPDYPDKGENYLLEYVAVFGYFIKALQK